ncbi:hypothetical protein I3F58_21475 [Streptomyces sp. MUM 203J]|nr:hypothetical protein [Streptomyces sp. MUM 203J]
MEQARTQGLTVQVGGSAVTAAPSGHSSEAVGPAAAAVVLPGPRWPLSAVGLPLLTAALGVGTGTSAIRARSGPLGPGSPSVSRTPGGRAAWPRP